MARFEILEAGPVLGVRKNGIEVRLNFMSWYGKMPTYDIRNWDGEKSLGGIALTPEMAEALRDELNKIDFSR
jgi:hypothetical protein